MARSRSTTGISNQTMGPDMRASHDERSGIILPMKREALSLRVRAHATRSEGRGAQTRALWATRIASMRRGDHERISNYTRQRLRPPYLAARRERTVDSGDDDAREEENFNRVAAALEDHSPQKP